MNLRITALSLAIIVSACGGGGGGTTTSTNTPLSATCVLKDYISTYPNSYLGANNIPTPTEKFDPTIERMVGLKDYYPSDNNGCATTSEYTRHLYAKTLDRLQAIGVTTVEIYQYGPVDDFNASTWTIGSSRWQIPKTELEWFFQETKRRGLKTTLVWQLWGVDAKGNQINTTNPTEVEVVKVLRGWGDIIVEMAKLGQANQVNHLLIQWSAFYYPAVTSYSETAISEFTSIISAIKAVYSGKLFMGTPRFYDKRIIEKVDAIVIPLTPSGWTYEDDRNISVALLKQRYSQSIQNYYSDFSASAAMATSDIPVIWDFNIQSRDKVLSEGWVEDGFCTTPNSNNGPVSYDDPLCIQKNYVTDFTVQALAIEGAFQAIKAQNLFKTYGINFSTGYWHTDTILASPEGFPNFSQSIRGKPSENIVKTWYAK